MRYRKLRIAWSVFWGFAAVLLIALSIRSLWWMDAATIPLPGGRSVEVGSALSCVGFVFATRNAPLEAYHQPIDVFRKTVEMGGDRPPSPWWGGSADDGSVIFIPNWASIFALIVFATLPWLPWSNRFSLRTLLIATTLVAVVLGLIVWLR